MAYVVRYGFCCIQDGMTAIDMARVVAREDIAEVLINAAEQHQATRTTGTQSPTTTSSEQPLFQHLSSTSAETTSSARQLGVVKDC